MRGSGRPDARRSLEGRGREEAGGGVEGGPGGIIPQPLPTPAPGGGHGPQIAVWCLLVVVFLAASVRRGWRPLDLAALRLRLSALVARGRCVCVWALAPMAVSQCGRLRVRGVPSVCPCHLGHRSLAQAVPSSGSDLPTRERVWARAHRVRVADARSSARACLSWVLAARQRIGDAAWLSPARKQELDDRCLLTLPRRRHATCPTYLDT